MKDNLLLFMHFILTLLKLLRPNGVKLLIAENNAMRKQLQVVSRGRKRSPPLTTSDRFVFGFLACFIPEYRLHKVAFIFKPATILKFHKALVERKYSKLYSNRSKKISGRKPQDERIIDLVIEMKELNPPFGYGRIAMQIYEAFGIKVSRFTVGRILRKNKGKWPTDDGPSWLTFIGHMTDSLWSVDLFRCESIGLKSYWVMVVIDQFTRRIIGFSVNQGDCDGVIYCRMFNEIISGKTPPKYLSSDNDPLFLFHRWKANLRIIDVTEIKSVPATPTSHPFIERTIGSVRRECLDQMLFFNKSDLTSKLSDFKTYFNNSRAHSSLEMKTPEAIASKTTDKNVIPIDCIQWTSHCGGLYKLPIAA